MEYPIVIKNNAGTVIDRVANADSAVTVLYGDLKARGREQYIVEIPDGPEWDRAAGWIAGEIRLNTDCYGLIQLDRVVRVEPPAPAPVRVVYCRVCGTVMRPGNTVDPVECPDECIDCMESEFPGMFSDFIG